VRLLWLPAVGVAQLRGTPLERQGGEPAHIARFEARLSGQLAAPVEDTVVGDGGGAVALSAPAPSGWECGQVRRLELRTHLEGEEEDVCMIVVTCIPVLALRIKIR